MSRLSYLSPQRHQASAQRLVAARLAGDAARIVRKEAHPMLRWRIGLSLVGLGRRACLARLLPLDGLTGAATLGNELAVEERRIQRCARVGARRKAHRRQPAHVKVAVNNKRAAGTKDE